jgi:hypothetical protein
MAALETVYRRSHQGRHVHLRAMLGIKELAVAAVLWAPSATHSVVPHAPPASTNHKTLLLHRLVPFAKPERHLPPSPQHAMHAVVENISIKTT